MYSISLILKDLKNVIAKCQFFFSSTTLETDTEQIINNLCNVDNIIGKTVKEASFKNLPPKIGYFNETTIPMYASYNMSSQNMNQTHPFITDFEGRELLYITAGSSCTAPRKIYRASRMSTSEPFSVENTPLKVACLPDTTFCSIMTVTSDYVILCTANTNGSANHWELVFTNSSGNSSTNWDKHINIQPLIDEAKKNGQVCDIIRCSNDDNTVYAYACLCKSSTETNIYVYSCTESNNTVADVVLVNTINVHQRRSASEDAQSTYNIKNCDVYNANMAYIKSAKTFLVTMHSSIGTFRKDNGTMIRLKRTFQCVAIEADWQTIKTNKGNRYGIPYDNHIKSLSALPGLPNNAQRIRITYDSLTDNIALCCCYWDDYLMEFHIHDAKTFLDKLKKSYSAISVADGHIESGIFNMPDTAPWAKKMGSIWVMYDSFGIHSWSKTYGERKFYVSLQRNGKGGIEITPGSWSLDSYPMSVICCCQRDDSQPYGCYWTNLSNISNTKIGVRAYSVGDRTDKSGNVHHDLLTLGSTIKEFDNEPSRVYSWYSNGNTPLGEVLISLCFGDRSIDSDGNAKNPDGYGYINVQYVNGQKEKYMLSDFTGFNIIKDVLNLSRDSLGTLARVYNNDQANTFIDSNGELYCCLYFYIRPCWDGTLSIKINLQTKTITNVGFCGKISYGPRCIGYNKKLGYYFTSNGNGYQSATVFFGKGSFLDSNNTTEYGVSDVLGSGNKFSFTLYNEGSVGLVAYMNSIPLFLGGYYSLLPAQEIYLEPNSDNYIYLYRDSTMNEAKVEVRQDQNVEVDNFHRIYVSKITTNASGPISQTYNEINNYK